ncbi:alkaline phosphatase family protein [Proteinivorax hydrogeniformans]|uniref:Alkaline phosphatase family protein n=1 Tax=Proteinivorax hydrogeniformans TaxID=1826727 RepID=A0AAU8HSZ1_9FIRM
MLNIKKHNKISAIVLISVGLLVLLLLNVIPQSGDSTHYMPLLEVVGDVKESVSLDYVQKHSEAVTINYRDDSLEVAPLEEVIKKANPKTERFDVLFISHDGYSALISNKNLEKSYIAQSKEYGWEAINKNHPPSSNVKDVKKIVIVSDDLSVEDSFNIIRPGENIASLSVGQLYKKGYSTVFTFRGESTIKNDGESLDVTTFNKRKIIDIEKYINDDEEALVVGKKGEEASLDKEGKLVLNNNSIGYVVNGELKIQDVVGVVIKPPAKRITDVYYDTKKMLNQEENVMLILIDGLGYHQYQYAKKNDYIPFLESLPEPQKAMVAYPSVTPVNLAASLTGELPYVNGVYKRGIRKVEVPTIFGFCKKQNKEAAAVIGPIGTIELEIPPVLSMDENNDGSTDDEKTENALKKMSKGLDLLFVHYKDVDIAGHNYGDLAVEILEDLKKIDSYVNQLVAKWDGKVIVYADHGMHKTEEGGDHGSLITEDMFMPYWIFNGGAINE